MSVWLISSCSHLELVISNHGGIGEHSLWISTNTSIIKVPDALVSFDLGCYFMDGKGEEDWVEGVTLLHTGGRI